MVKSICSMLCVLVIIVVGALCESTFVIKQFEEFESASESLYEKTEEQTAVKDDAVALQENWLNKKKYLHNFIPHTEIKEMDINPLLADEQDVIAVDARIRVEK